MYTYPFFEKEYYFCNFCKYLLLRKVPYNLVIEPLFFLTDEILFRSLRSFVSWSLWKTAKKTTFLLHENYFLFLIIPSMHMIYSTNAINYSKHSLQDTLKRNKNAFYKKDIIGKQVFELLENILFVFACQT